MTPTFAARAAAITARGLAGPGKNFSPPGESSKFAMHWIAAGVGRSASTLISVSGCPMPVRPQAPDQTLADEPLEGRPHLFDEGRIRRHAQRGVRRATVDERRVGHYIGMQKEQ